MSQVFQEYMPVELQSHRNDNADVEREVFEQLHQLLSFGSLETPKATVDAENLETEFEQVQKWLDEFEQNLSAIPVTEEEISDGNENESSYMQQGHNVPDQSVGGSNSEIEILEISENPKTSFKESTSADSRDDSDADSEIMEIPVTAKTSYIRLILFNADAPDGSAGNSEPEILKIPVDTTTSASLKRDLLSDNDIVEVYRDRINKTKELTGKRQETKKRPRTIVLDVSSSDEEVDVESLNPTRNMKPAKIGKTGSLNLKVLPQSFVREEEGEREKKKPGAKPTRRSPRFVGHP